MAKKKTPPKKSSARLPTGTVPAVKPPSRTDLKLVLGLIAAARTKAVAAVNTTLIDLYWNLGQFISRKTAEDGWGKGTVETLAQTIQKRYPGATGYSVQNLWRMRQFFETYRDSPILSSLVRELPWTHNLLIMSRSKRDEEREFYLRVCVRERWDKRDLERQLAGALFERTVLSPTKLSAPLRELHRITTRVAPWRANWLTRGWSNGESSVQDPRVHIL